MAKSLLKVPEILKMNVNLDEAKKTMEEVGKVAGDVGNSISENVTQSVKGMSMSIMQAGSDFDESMKVMAAYSGATGAQFQELEELARTIGKTTEVSMQEAADAMAAMSMSGATGEEILKSFPSIVNLATVSTQGLGASVDQVSGLLQGFEMDADEAGRLVDILASVAQHSDATVEGLSEGLGVAASMADSMGFSIEDVSSAIGLMANNGIEGEAAGRMLQDAMGNLVNPTEEVQSLMGELGMNFAESGDGSRSLNEMLESLRNGFSGLEEEQQNQIASMIFGEESMSGMLGLIQTGAGDMETMNMATEAYAGTAANMAASMRDDGNIALAEMTQAMDDMTIMLSNALIPFFDLLAGALQWVVEKFSALSEGQQKMVAGIVMVTAVMGPILVGLSTLIGALGSIGPMIGIISKGFLLLQGGLAGTIAPIIAIIAAIVLLVKGFMELYNSNEAFREQVNLIWSQVVTIISDFIQGIIILIQRFIESFLSLWEAIRDPLMETLGALWQTVMDIILLATQTIMDIIDVFTGLFTGSWDEALTALVNLLVNMFTNIEKVLRSGLDLLLSFFGTSLEELETMVSNSVDNIIGFFVSIGEKVRGVFDDIRDFFVNFKLPKFVIETSSKTILGRTITYPSGFDVDWHAEGGIFTRPTIIGGHGFGEAGKEAILPLNRLPGLLGLDKGNMNHITIYLDGKKIYAGIDGYLGKKVLGGV